MKTKIIVLILILFMGSISAGDQIIPGNYTSKYEDEETGESAKFMIELNDSSFISDFDLGEEDVSNCQGLWNLSLNCDTLSLYSRNCINLWNIDESEHEYEKSDDLMYPIKDVSADGFKMQLFNGQWVIFTKITE